MNEHHLTIRNIMLHSLCCSKLNTRRYLVLLPAAAIAHKVAHGLEEGARLALDLAREKPPQEPLRLPTAAASACPP